MMPERPHAWVVQPQPISAGVIVGYSLLCLGVTGIAWLAIWGTVYFYSQRELVDSLTVVGSWVGAATFAALGIAGASVCLAHVGRVGRRSRLRAVMASAVALLAAVGTLVVVVALPLL